MVSKRHFRGKKTTSISDDRVVDYCVQYVWPYVAEKKRDVGKRPYSILTISDTHATFLNPVVWSAFLRAIKVLKPSAVCFNGDTLEGSALSGYTKIPGWVIPLQLEFDFQREMVKQVRAVGHSGDLYVGAGNHGLDRLVKYLSTDAKAFESLRCVRIDKLMGLEEFDVKLMQHGWRFSPDGEEDLLPGFQLFDHFWAYHGTKTAKHAAWAEMTQLGYSGFSGHVHRAQVYYGGTLRHPDQCWMSLPCGCTDKAARSYIRSPHTGWNQGFGYSEVWPDGHVYQAPSVLHRDTSKISCMGITFKGNEDWTEPDHNTMWLKHLRIPR